ncbi:MAG: class I SAM-dependent methyltransferase [Syntrophales bacterium]|nr:class I SAM-dependent methyltransferase [Syntrophales bacterium]
MRRKKFNPEKILKLNNPERLKDIPTNFIWERLQLKETPKKIVDVGAGTGLFTVAFSQLAPLATVFACDIAPEMITWLKEKVSPLHPQIVPLLMEECHLPLPEGVVDLLYMINLHHELEQPIELLTDCRRVLKPTGILFIVDWKAEKTEHGPPLPLRVPPEVVERQLQETHFVVLSRHEEMKYHYLIIAQKNPQCPDPAR